MTISPNPRDHGVPHSTWRPEQLDAVKKTYSLYKDGGGLIFVEAPTGIGKSGLAASLGNLNRVTVLVGTLNLEEQYEKNYGFAGVKGKQAYPCKLQKKIEKWKRYGKKPTAADCHLDEMWRCDAASSCEYLHAKTRAIGAQRTVVTYKYAMLSHQIRKRGGILVCDEAHMACEEIISHASFTVTSKLQQDWKLPSFPWTRYGPDGKGQIPSDADIRKLAGWLNGCIDQLSTAAGWFDPLEEQAAKAQKLISKFQRARENLSITTWFLECASGITREYYRGRWRNSFALRIRALDARTVASMLWKNTNMQLLMSATIGDPAPLANELGIEKYKEAQYEHPVPAEYRPIHDLEVERMTHANLVKNPNLYKVQANQIHRWIKKRDSSWRGIILTTSYKKIKKLAENIVPKMNDRKFIVQKPGNKVNEITSEFITNPQPGDILIASIQGFGHGLDLSDDLARYCVVAGVPHSNPQDPYERARKSRPGGGKYAWWKAYSAIPQAAGRVSRGERNGDGWLLNEAVLADGSTTTNTAMRYYSSWFRKAIVR